MPAENKPGSGPVCGGAAWARRAGELAAWAWGRCVNRTDVWGGYLPLGRPGRRVDAAGKAVNWLGPYTRPARAERGKVVLTPRVLARHFAAAAPEHVAGTHTTSTANTSLWGAVEVDSHGPGGTDPRTNFDAALGWYAGLAARGFRPLLTDSNGRGGYHLRVLLSSAVPAVLMFWFLRGLTRDHQARGLPAPPETFPKQPALEPGRCGNWLRLPGRHHTHAHWSRVWGGARWVEGEEAVDYLLITDRRPPGLLPETRPAPAAPPRPAPGRRVPAPRAPGMGLDGRVAAYMARLPNLGEGQGRDDVAYHFACFLARDLALPDVAALAWLSRWDEGNRLPKGPDSLRKILANAHAYGHRPYGCGLGPLALARRGRHGWNVLSSTVEVW